METTHFAVARPISGGFLDRIEVDPSGIIRLIGWSKKRFDIGRSPRVCLDGDAIPFLQDYRVSRPDVPPSGSNIIADYLGLVLEYLVPEPMRCRRFASLALTLPSESALHFAGTFEFINPHYGPLFDTRQVYHREDIYGSGPPNLVVNPDTLALARQLRDPILDFGCGSGALIQQLTQLGLKAHGLELESEIIKASITAEIEPFITLYNGQFPSPFRTRSFRSVFCSEVLEHIPDYGAAIHDIARIATEKVIFTVPDASGIPAGFRHGVVPWHLLEGTHVNFFTQSSLLDALKGSFSAVEFARIGGMRLNDSVIHVSLVAACLK